MRMNAAAQAWSFSVLSGASEYVKIVNGSVAIACRGSVTTALRKIDVVNRSGAVSPAARATASVEPVRMPPRTVGRIDEQHRPPLGDPEREAGLAQRARDEIQHLDRRPRDEREHHNRERERGLPRRLAGADDEKRVDEDADHDRRHAVQDVEREPHVALDLLVGELRDVDRDRTPVGSANTVASATMMSEPTMAFLMPPPDSPKVACTCVNRSRLSAGIARWITLNTTIAENGDRAEGREGRDELGDTVCDQAPPSAAVRLQRRTDAGGFHVRSTSGSRNAGR